MDHCFVVLELPGGSELKFVNDKSTPNFWKSVARTIREGKAKIISKRRDTGISEDLRRHVAHVDNFKTYVLVDMHLAPAKCGERDIFKKVSSWLTMPGHDKVIDTAENFQLVTIDV